MDHGAHFHRCDLQVHTPRDLNWDGPKPTTEPDRAAFARDLVDACRAKGVQAIAVTDHHDFAFVDVIRDAAADERRANDEQLAPADQLVVFPGLELTLSVPCQALLILDSAFPSDRLPTLLERLAIDPADSALESHAQPVALHFENLQDLYAELDRTSWLRGRYIVLPNVTDGGHKTLMRSGMHEKYRLMPCVGGYVDGDIPAPESGNAQIFAGLDKSRGYKSIAVFQTSDSRSHTFERLGRHSTWVKWAVPTAEALRQACLAPASRVSHGPPLSPSVVVSRLSVSNSRFLGPIDIDLNRQYNALIGGRGTGKSSLLGYLRWALCDQPVAGAEDDDLADPRRIQQRLIETTLEPVDGQVEVDFEINGIPHVVRRTARSGELLLKIAAEPFSSAREEDIRALLPIHAYSQKQLSSVSIRIDELMRFVTAPIRSQLAAVDQRLATTGGSLRENYASLQRARLLSRTVDRLTVSEVSLTQQAANMRAGLTGLSDDDRAVLNERPAVEQARAALGSWEADIGDATERIAQVAAEVGRLRDRLAPVPTDLSGSLSDAASRLRRMTSDAIENLETALRAAADALKLATVPASGLASQRDSLATTLDALDNTYELVKARSTVHEEKLEELSAIDQERSAAADALEQARRELSELGDPQQRHDDLRAELLALYAERSALLASQCETLTDQAGGLLVAEMRRGQGLADVEARFRGLVSGSGLRADRIEPLFTNLRQESDPINAWDEVLTDLERLAEHEAGVDVSSEMTPTLSRLGLRTPDQQRVALKLTPDGWLDLALTPIADEPTFSYRTKEAKTIEFGLASPGQQATALLKVLLAQGGMPLVIDQPEEDLDSEAVQEVVEWLEMAKQRRQIIIASHNANLVVNGDAELVVVCQYRVAGDQSRGKVAFDGAIDVPRVRVAITDVMEGGEKAFKLRKEKYGF